MDILPILFDAQLVLIIGILVYWALMDFPKRRKAAQEQEHPAPAMTAEEVIAVCNSLHYGS